MRQHDVAAGRLFAQRIFEHGEVGTVLLGGRDFTQMVIAVDTDRVLAEALVVVLNGTAAGGKDELASRSLAVQVLGRCQTGGDVAGTDGLTVLPDGQGLIRTLNRQRGSYSSQIRHSYVDGNTVRIINPTPERRREEKEKFRDIVKILVYKNSI